MAEEINDRNSAAEVVTLANSANYIFNNLKKDPAVSRVSISKSSEEVIGWLRENLPIKPTTVSELTERYVYLVALSFFEPREYLAALDSLPLDMIEWGGKLATIIRARARGTTVTNFKVPPRVTAAGQISFPANSASSRIIISGDKR